MQKSYLFLIFLVSLSIFGVHTLAKSGPESRPAVSPMMQEIQTTLAQEAAAIKALQEDLDQAPTEADALAILRQIRQRKQDTEVAILRIQGRFARESGNQAAATRIDEAIQKILNPVPVKPSPEALQEMEARRTAGQSHE